MRQAYIEAHDLRIWAAGEIIGPEDLNLGLGWIESPDWIVAKRWFIDCSQLSKIDLGYDNMYLFSQRNQSILKDVTGIRVAIFIQTEVAYGMVRMYQTLMTGAGLDFRIFRERTECAAFLGVPEDALEFPPEEE